MLPTGRNKIASSIQEKKEEVGIWIVIYGCDSFDGKLSMDVTAGRRASPGKFCN
jgi:hypothetical protein